MLQESHFQSETGKPDSWKISGFWNWYNSPDEHVPYSNDNNKENNTRTNHRLSVKFHGYTLTLKSFICVELYKGS